jgi:hypothetical protein
MLIVPEFDFALSVWHYMNWAIEVEDETTQNRLWDLIVLSGLDVDDFNF